jgi:prepilin-type N-terminal cleavage/methylation domain-containing protein
MTPCIIASEALDPGRNPPKLTRTHSSPHRSVGPSALPGKCGGFSLLEVMVAAAILSVATVALFQLFSMGLRGTKKAEDYSRGLIIARSLLDEAYALKDPSDAYFSTDFEEGFTAERNVEKIQSDSESGSALYLITVSVTWQPSGNLTLKGKRFVLEEDEAE